MYAPEHALKGKEQLSPSSYLECKNHCEYWSIMLGPQHENVYWGEQKTWEGPWALDDWVTMLGLVHRMVHERRINFCLVFTTITLGFSVTAIPRG